MSLAAEKPRLWVALINQPDGLYSARCACGWQGRARHLRDNAELDAFMHREQTHRD